MLHNLSNKSAGSGWLAAKTKVELVKCLFGSTKWVVRLIIQKTEGFRAI
jgi:hypothetical protein